MAAGDAMQGLVPRVSCARGRKDACSTPTRGRGEQLDQPLQCIRVFVYETGHLCMDVFVHACVSAWGSVFVHETQRQ